jgi:hypothetical protein
LELFMQIQGQHLPMQHVGHTSPLNALSTLNWTENRCL